MKELDALFGLAVQPQNVFQSSLSPSQSHFLLSGTLVTLPQPSMKTFNISGSGVKIDVAAIEWPANATFLALKGRSGGCTLVCSTTDSKLEGAETSEIRIGCEPDQVIGTSSAVSRNDIIRMRTHEPCLSCAAQQHTLPHFSHYLSSSSLLYPFLLPRRSMLILAGDLTQWHLPVGMKGLNLQQTEVTGKAHMSKGHFS